jgi:hypothetical protein
MLLASKAMRNRQHGQDSTGLATGLPHYRHAGEVRSVNTGIRRFEALPNYRLRQMNELFTITRVCALRVEPLLAMWLHIINHLPFYRLENRLLPNV